MVLGRLIYQLRTLFENINSHKQVMNGFRAKVRKMNLDSWRNGEIPSLGGYMGPVRDVTSSEGHRVIVKKDSFSGLDHTLRRHRAFHQMAHEIEAGHMVTPAVSKKNTKREKLFVTQHAGENFAPVSFRDSAGLHEGDKQNGLFLHIATGTLDGHGGNVLRNEEGRQTLIDHDLAFEANKPSGANNRKVSIYLDEDHAPKNPELTEPQKAFLRKVRNSSHEALKKEYKLRSPEVRVLKRHGAMIASHGLVEAAKKLGYRDAYSSFTS